MKKLLLISLLLLSLYSFTQIQNEKGIIILEGNDTISGSITYYNDFSSKVTYSDSTNIINSCTIDCINEIILKNGNQYTTLTYNNLKVFVQKLIISDLISLYSSEENGAVYYYISKDSNNYKLENNEFIIKGQDKKKYLNYDYKYIGILKMTMSDKPELFDKIDKLKLTEKDISNIILDYNQGRVSYYLLPKSPSKTPSNWVAFGQYSNFGNYYFSQPVIGLSYGFFGGVQVYYSKNRRHSFKFSFGYSNYLRENEYSGDYGITYTKKNETSTISLGATYEYIFFMTQRTNIYTQINIGELSYISERIEDKSKNNYLAFVPRFSPGIGLEYKTMNRISFYIEMNSLLNMVYIPINFTAGIKYDIGKLTGNIL